MHVGLGLCFQALDGKMSDKDIYRFELGLAARAESAGFDSIWTPVLPATRAHDVGGDLGVAYGPELQYAAAE